MQSLLHAEFARTLGRNAHGARAHLQEEPRSSTGHHITTPPASTPTRARGPAEKTVRMVRSAAAGDERGWDALVDEFGGIVWAVVRAHRLGGADAADAAQVTWLRLLEHIDRLKEPARVGAWLATTARRECLRVLHNSRRLVPLDESLPDRESSELLPDEVLLVAECDEALWRAFAGLRASDQTLLRLLMADPRPRYEEVSAALGMPIGSIAPTRARALERLRQNLKREGMSRPPVREIGMG